MSEFKSPLAIPSLKKDKPPPPPAFQEENKEEPPGGQDVDSEMRDEAAPESEVPAVDLRSSENPEGKERRSQRMKQEDPGVKKERYDKIMSTIPYREPLGSAPADSRYNLEVIKGGSVVDRVNFREKRFFIVGRIPACDIIAENPTVSRVHAILQFIDGKWKGPDAVDTDKVESEEDGNEKETQVREKGLYLYDLGSTHGTYVNKNRVYPNRFYRLRVGHVIKFGNSARLYIVGGPDDDEEEESDKTVSELLQERLQKELERKKLMEKMEEVEVVGRDVVEEGISWGMPEDAQEDTENLVNPFAIDFQSSELTLDNPKRTLRGWFEREGYELEYDVREKAVGHFICRVDLPLDGPDGGKVFAEVEVKGKKKEAVHQCALQACQILDKYGVLRQSHHEGRTKRKNRDWADEDYYSSDEDTFLDRTGTVEKKREKRMREAGKIEPKVETFESLLEKHKSFQKEIEGLQAKISKAETAHVEDDEVDPLDAFMTDLKAGAPDIKKLKSKLRELTTEQAKNKKLLDIAKPAIDPISLSSSSKDSTLEQTQPVPSPEHKIQKPSSEISETPKPSDVVAPKKSEAPLFGPRVQFKVSSRQLLPSKPLKKLEEPEAAKEIKPEAEVAENEDSDEEVTSSGIQENEDKFEIPTPKDIAPLNIHSEGDNSDNEDKLEEASLETTVTPTKKRQRIRKRPEKIKQIECDYDAEDPNYSVWVPPPGQKGDGKTALNEKLGY